MVYLDGTEQDAAYWMSREMKFWERLLTQTFERKATTPRVGEGKKFIAPKFEYLGEQAFHDRFLAQ